MENKKDYLPQSKQPLSDIKESLILQKLSWMLKKKPKNNTNLIDHIKNYFYPIVHPDKPNFDYNNFSNAEKKKRILLALEKLNSANHHLFSKKEQKILTPSRIGVWQKTYFFTLNGINFSWLIWTLSSKSFFKKNLIFLSVFSLSNYFFLQSIPLRLKERVRFNKGTRLAEVYLEKEKGEMEKFVKILNPFVSHHYLEHFKFD